MWASAADDEGKLRIREAKLFLSPKLKFPKIDFLPKLNVSKPSQGKSDPLALLREFKGLTQKPKKNSDHCVCFTLFERVSRQKNDNTYLK